MDAPSTVSATAPTRIRRDSAVEDPRTSVQALSLTGDVGNAGHTVEEVLAQKRDANPRDLFFAIPCACVGGVIGRGGQILRDMQAEFNVKVYVEKEEYSGLRIVRLTYLGSYPNTSTNTNSSSSSARKGTVKRSAAGSDDEEQEADPHKRNRRDESIRREEEGKEGTERRLSETRENDTQQKDRETSTSTSTRASNGSAPKRKGTSETGDGLEGEEGGNVSKKVREGNTAGEEASEVQHLQQQPHDEGEEGADEAESRLKRKRGDVTESVSHSSVGNEGSSDLSSTDAGLPLRTLLQCKERIEARIEELLQKQIADASSI